MLRVFRWTESSATALPGPDPSEGSTAYEINESGLVAGNYGPSVAVWKGTAFEALAALESTPAGMNDAGNVVGRYADEQRATHGAVWAAASGRRVRLEAPTREGYVPATFGAAINNSDHAAGVASYFALGPYAAVWLSNGRGEWPFHDLNCVVPEGFDVRLHGAIDINERGDILAMSATGPGGVARNFILSRAVNELLALRVANTAAREGSRAARSAVTRSSVVLTQGRTVFTITRSGTGSVSTVRYSTVAGTAKPGRTSSRRRAR
ncbi:MAG: DUF3466 family protein [Actinomycetota bacterium]|nr:DUF3466 family protein [Actinomycetota bacterium]